MRHLKNPWNTLKMAAEILSTNGTIVISVPNICHYSTIYSLLFRDHWPYRERGIHDKTHLRFFTYSNILDLLDSAHLTTTRLIRRYRLIESHALGPLDRVAWIFLLPFLKRMLTFQYVVVAQKKDAKILADSPANKELALYSSTKFTTKIDYNPFLFQCW